MAREHWLLYGATGYTGRRIAEWCVARGIHPVLAARRGDELRGIATRLGLAHEALVLDNADVLAASLRRYTTVLNCAGPFAQTWRPMIEACVVAGTHYLDITGEIGVYEGLAEYEDAARRAGIVIMPAVGFDMVPGDCLALALQQQLPDADTLDIGYSFEGTITRGSIRSALASFVGNNQVRREHRLVALEQPLVRRFDFGAGAHDPQAECYATTFGDLSIAWRTTRIPNITSYLHFTPSFQKLAQIASEADIAALPEGAPDEELRTHQAFIVGEVRNAEGKCRRARLVTPQVYAATFPLAGTIAQRVHEGVARPGYQTAAGVFGAAFVLGFERFRLEWLPDHADGT